VNAVPDGDVQHALVVLQFGDVDDRLAFTAHVNESHFMTDPDEGALDGLAAFDALCLLGRFEHRREIFIELGHGVLLLVCLHTTAI
jgi:hypothetical protein